MTSNTSSSLTIIRHVLVADTAVTCDTGGDRMDLTEWLNTEKKPKHKEKDLFQATCVDVRGSATLVQPTLEFLALFRFFVSSAGTHRPRISVGSSEGSTSIGKLSPNITSGSGLSNHTEC